jgi:hypothetical protein
VTVRGIYEKVFSQARKTPEKHVGTAAIDLTPVILERDGIETRPVKKNGMRLP